MYELFVSLGVPNNPTMHQSYFASWVFVEFMHTQVEDDIIKVIQYAQSMHTEVEDDTIKVIQYAQFIALSCDEVTIVGNGSWICIHAYVVDD